MRQKYIMSLELARVYLKIVELQLLYNSSLYLYPLILSYLSSLPPQEEEAIGAEN